MSSTDDRIVRMQFDNASFKKRAAETKKDLADVNKAVDSAGKGKGLMDMASHMDKVQVSASKMQVVTTAALATIASKATLAAGALVKGLTLDPITQGFQEYEQLLTKQNVIMNATGKSAEEVKAYLNDLNHYSDQTVYSFSNMTDSITKFVNAGVDMDTAVVSIKGIANAAAYSGATTEEANRAMYAFSQSMQTGYVMLNDWQQIENANMGTMRFKEELLKAGVAQGTLTKRGNEYITASGKVVTAGKGWREGLQEQWASTEVLNSALGKYADTNTKLGKKAFEAATQVRTFTAFMSTLKESLGSGWASIFTALFGNLEEATALWTGLSTVIGNGVKGFFGWLTTALQTWRAMGGFQKVLQGFMNILSPFVAIVKVLGKAFKEAFPSSDSGAGKGLYKLSAGFEAVTRPLRWLAKLIEGSAPVVKVFFQIIAIGIALLKGGIGVVADFVKKAAGLVDLPSGGGFLDFIKDVARQLGNAIDKISDLLRKGKSLTEAFGSVNISMPDLPNLPSLPSLPSIGGIFGGDDKGSESKIAALTGGVKTLKGSVEDLDVASERARNGGMFNPNAKLDTSRMRDSSDQFRTAADDLTTWGDRFKNLGNSFMDFLGNLVDGVADFVSGFSMEDVVKSFNMALISTFIFRFMNMMKSFQDILEAGANIKGGFADMLNSASGALGSFQTAANAKLITAIAIAIGILVVSLWILSMIPKDKLVTALGALATVMGLMAVTFKVMSDAVNKMEKDKIGLKMIGLSVALIAMGLAMILLATAFLIMNKVEWPAILAGLFTIVIVMKVIQNLGEVSNEKAAKNILAGAVAILTISFAMIVLAGALLLFKLVDWESIGKGGAVIGGLTLALAIMAKLPTDDIAKVGLAMLAASVGMVAMAVALLIMNKVEWESIKKLVWVLGLLVISLGALMVVATPNAVTGLVGMGFAMMGLATAGLILNKVDWESIKKMAWVMGILVVGLAAFFGVMALAAPIMPVLLVFAGSLALLAGAFFLISLALGAFIALGAAATAAFIAFATAAALGIGAFFQTLALQAPVIKDAIIAILGQVIEGIVQAVPMIIQGIKDLWTAIMAELGGGGEKGGKGGGAKGMMMQGTGESWISKLAKGIRDKLPEIIQRGVEIIVAFLNGIASRAKQLVVAAAGLVIKLIEGLKSKISDLVNAGVDLILKLIGAVAKRAGDITKTGADLIIAFIRGITKEIPRLIVEGLKLILKFINSLADNIRANGDVVGEAAYNLASAIIEGLVNGIKAFASKALDSIKDLAGNMVDEALGVFEVFSPSRVFKRIGKFVVMGLTQGVQRNAASAITAVGSMVKGSIALATEYVSLFMNRMEQQTIAAEGKAAGLAAAAEKATKAAEKTKTKKDDKAAVKLTQRAEAADRSAQNRADLYEAQKNEVAKWTEFNNADDRRRAEMKAEDAKNQIDAAKAAERRAVAARAEAQALAKQAETAGLGAGNSAARQALRSQAANLRIIAAEQARQANTQLALAKASASQAMMYQARAGAEAAAAFATEFRNAAAEARDLDAFEKLSDADKAKRKRLEQKAMEEASKETLARAQKLAYTDIEKANEMAQLALDYAEQGRQLAKEAAGYENSGTQSPGALNKMLDVTPAAAALKQMTRLTEQYDRGVIAARSGTTINIDQTLNSPENISAGDAYRQTNNAVTYAANALTHQPAA